MNTRVLICRATPIDPDPRVEKIARALAESGCEVEILGWDMTGSYPAVSSLSGLPLYRCRVPARFGRGLINITHQIRWQWALLKWLLRRRGHYGFIHACDFDTLIPALLFKRLTGVRVIYDIFDFYADMLRATPQRIVRLIRWLDLRLIGAADAVILADESRYQQIAGSRPRRSLVVYNSPEDSLASPDSAQLTPSSEDRPALGSGMRLAYVGNLQVERGLLVLLDVLSQHPEWSLDLAGFGGDEGQIAGRARRMPNVIWHGRVAHDRAMHINRQADVLLATYDPAIPNHHYSSPNKLFEAMQLGKPVIVARATNMDRIVEEASCGLVVEYGDVTVLEEALKRLELDPRLRQALGENGRQVFERAYSWDRMKQRLLDLYAALGAACA